MSETRGVPAQHLPSRKGDRGNADNQTQKPPAGLEHPTLRCRTCAVPVIRRFPRGRIPRYCPTCAAQRITGRNQGAERYLARVAYFRAYYATHRARILAQRARRKLGVICGRCQLPRGTAEGRPCMCGPERRARPAIRAARPDPAPVRVRVAPLLSPTDPFRPGAPGPWGNGW